MISSRNNESGLQTEVEASDCATVRVTGISFNCLTAWWPANKIAVSRFGEDSPTGRTELKIPPAGFSFVSV